MDERQSRWMGSLMAATKRVKISWGKTKSGQAYPKRKSSKIKKMGSLRGKGTKIVNLRPKIIKRHPDGTQTQYQIGDKVKVASDNDNDGYDDFRNKILIVDHVAVSTDDHQGYDDGVAGEALYDFHAKDGTEIHVSLYDWELESV